MIKRPNEEGQTEGNNLRQTNHSKKKMINVKTNMDTKKGDEERIKT
jgi:hypothetical protein